MTGDAMNEEEENKGLVFAFAFDSDKGFIVGIVICVDGREVAAGAAAEVEEAIGFPCLERADEGCVVNMMGAYVSISLCFVGWSTGTGEGGGRCHVDVV